MKMKQRIKILKTLIRLKILPLILISFWTIGALAQVKFLPSKVVPAGTDPEYYSAKPDFAMVERWAPLSPQDRKSLSPALLKSYSQEKLDQLYARLASGPIPQGDYEGSILVKNELVLTIEKMMMDKMINRKSFGGFFQGLAIKVLCGSRDRLECLGEFLWKGKHFYPPEADGSIELRNAINLKLRNSMILKAAGLSALDKPLSQAQVQDFNHDKRMMLMPAHVYCGISLADTRRESIIIDYAYGDDFKPFIPEVDGLVTRNGKVIRDEIRMIRPGLYLGRAYVENIFLLNFVLESKSTPSLEIKNQCWTGNSWQ